MSKFAARLLTLGIFATALMVVPMVTPAKAETGSRHKHKKSFGDHPPAGQAWPVTRPSSPAGDVCPGIARSFECKIWPPPMDEDPDRKHSSSDGG